jgi:hypothetical protein
MFALFCAVISQSIMACSTRVYLSFYFPSFAQSMFHAHRSSRSTPTQMVQLWQHECARVFHDRILDAPTRAWFDKALQQVGWKARGVGVLTD